MRVHFMGVGGSGISGIADLAQKMGYKVSGCDLEAQTAYAENIFKGHDVKHLEGIDLLVVSPAIFYQNPNNSELIEGQKRKIVMTWQEFLGKILLKDKKVICIAGTHGKSTTTAMAGHLLTDAGFDPIVVIGAKVPEWGGNSRFGKGEYAVVEADEFNNNFLNYHPDIAIINNIEFDHPDFFKNEEEIEESFNKFIKNLKGEKILITSEDSPHKHFNLKVFGEHNQKNANMVYVLGKKLEIKDEDIVKSLETFQGIERRMQLIIDKNGVKVYDDYAHHPTAIKTTLEGVRSEFPKEKILAIVEPHGYKRTKALLSKYKGVFDSVDKVMIGPIFQARDEVDESITPEKVANSSGHKNALGVSSLNEIIENWKLEIGNYDVVVIMGAGKSYLWAREISKLIGKQEMKSEKDKKFRDITTFHVGGEISEYLEIENRNEISSAVSFAKKIKQKIFILGDGSDILASDTKFDDFVLRYVGKNFSINGEIITAEAGMKWDDLVKISVENNLQGLENLSGIPGTVGASPIQNIGAYGSELKDTFLSLEAYNIEKEKFEIFDKEKCQFGYRESVFKQKTHWQKYIIVSVIFKLNKGGRSKVNYESLHLKDNPTLVEVRDAILKTRREKLENPKEHGNAGSFFKNPIIDLNKKKELEEKYPDVKIYPFEDKFKIFAGWLIENAGMKGKELGGAAVSPKHALILINKTGKATADEVYKLSEMIIDEVDKKFGIKLEREVQLINF